MDKAKGEKIQSVQFIPPAIDPTQPDIDYIRAQVQKALVAASQPTPAPTPTATPVKKKKKPTADAGRRAKPIVAGEAMNVEDTCRYS